MTRQKSKTRKGVATVELAVVLPVLLALVFGSIEVCQRLYTKQSVVIAAYESCRVASRQVSGTAAAQNRCEELLAQQNIRGATVQIRDITHGQDTLDSVTTGDEIRVRITVPWAENVISRYVISDQGSLVMDAVMLRE
jgi:Flp pilus assembly protein TadG